MEVSKVIYGRIGPRGTYTVGEITEEDYGAVFQMPDLDLPAAYNVDFSNNPHAGTALTVIGNEDGAEIPKDLIDTGRDVYAYLYWVGEGFGKTAFSFRIRNNRRPKRGHPAPDPEQQSVIDQTIAALNTAVASTHADAEQTASDAERAETAREAAESARDGAETAALNAEVSKENAAAYVETAIAEAALAKASADNAQQSASSASRDADRAEQAMNQAGYIHFEIREDGHLWMTKTDGVDVDFYLGEDGHLYVTTD